MSTKEVADRFYELCSKGEYHEAMQELYADDARHVEAVEFPGAPYPRVLEGKGALLDMSTKWMANTEVHSSEVTRPLVNDEHFVCEMTIDATSKEGPMAGQRHKMSETCLYTVKDGKIAEAKFFYSMDC